MIEIILLLACCCFIFIVALAGWFLTRGEEGDECEGKDDNGNYEIDEDLKCVLKSCATGYYKSGKNECTLDQSGATCVPTGTPDPKGIYLTGLAGGCELSCETGYAVDGTTCTPTEYVYEFIVNVQNEHAIYRLHLGDIKIDGVRATSNQVEIHVAPNRYVCGTKTDECVSDTTLGYIDAAGDMTWAAWDEEDDDVVYTVGDKIFTVTSPTKVSSFQIAYQRPMYAPGWIIKENGVEAIKETANRGSESTPSPITYTYTIP